MLEQQERSNHIRRRSRGVRLRETTDSLFLVSAARGRYGNVGYPGNRGLRKPGRPGSGISVNIRTE
ncbi:hypothetical protein CCP3SC1AL1_110006 [Gammaproteobacteria bacterium]